MAAFGGWVIICMVLCAISGALLLPAALVLRRVRRSSRRFWPIYAAATAGGAVALWFALPPLVAILFGQATR